MVRLFGLKPTWLFACGFLIVGPICATADDTVREAQQLLTTLGYDPGPVDGAMGNRTATAMGDFLDSNGATYDGTIDVGELKQLREAVVAFTPALKFPGRLFDTTYGKSSQCNALAPSRYSQATEGAGQLAPVAKLDDAVSIGRSSKWDSIDPWLKTVLSEAARFSTTNSAEAGEFALTELEEWASADAVLGTPVDASYQGRGNRGNYRPSASAPVLDMENAAQLGYAVYYALAMLDGMPAERLLPVRNWADALVDKYGGPIGDAIFSQSPNGIWRLEGRPLLAKAILDGDEDAYRTHVEAYYNVIREVVSDSGAILKNANRGDRALHYQSQGLLAIAAVLDIVQNQGGRIPADIEEEFQRAVQFMLDADRDIALIAPLAREGFNNPGDGSTQTRFYRENAEHYWWMIFYLSNYPDAENASRIRYLLAMNDTFDRVDRDMMASTWVPYPINCYRPFDMTPEAVESATGLVTSKFPEVDDGIAASIATGIGDVVSESTFDVTRALVSTQYEGQNFVEYLLRLRGSAIDGEEVEIPAMSIFTDFSGGSDEVENLRLFRLVFRRNVLQDPASRSADYLVCGELSAQIDEGEQQLRLHVGHGAEKNACILAKMAEVDRNLWSAVLANFSIIADKLPDSDAGLRVKELYAFVK